MMTYSLDFRKKVLQVKEEQGLSLLETAKRFGIGIASVMRWTKKIEPQSTREKPCHKINMEDLKQDIMEIPDAFLVERAKRFGVSHNAIWLALKRLGVTYKKNPGASQAEGENYLFR